MKTSIRPKLRHSSVPGMPGSLYFQVCHDRHSVQITTPIRLLPDNWDALRMCVCGGRGKRRQRAASELPASLQRAQRRICDETDRLRSVVAALSEGGRYFTVRDVQRGYARLLGHGDFFRFVRQQAEILERERRMGTARNYLTAMRMFAACVESESLPFSFVTANQMREFEQFLRGRGLRDNTISCYMRSLRACYNRAVAEGCAKGPDPFEGVFTGMARTEKRAAGVGTVRRLLQLPLSGTKDEAFARDLFVFSFYARGMAFVDMAFLRKADVDGERIVYRRRKTGQSLEVRLEPCMVNIVEKYQARCRRSPYLFPILTETEEGAAYRQYRCKLGRYNILLKELARRIGFEGTLSSYVARHTWATEARNKGVPLSVISAGMGHASERTTQIYLASIDNALIDDANHYIIMGVGE